MKNILIKSGLLSLTVVAVLGSCSKNSPKPAPKLTYQFKVTNAVAALSATAHASSGLATSSLGATTSTNVTWQSGYATVSSISFDGNNENEGNKNEEDDFIESSPFKVDLFNGNTLLGNVDIAYGTYQNINIKLELKRTSVDSALYLKGTYTPTAGSTVPVILSLDGKSDDLEILVKARNLTVAANQSYIEFLDLHLDILMTGVTTTDLDAATLTKGAIIINATSNTAIYNKVLANLNNFCDGEGD